MALPTVDKLRLTVNNNLHLDSYIDTIVARAYRLCSCIPNGFYAISSGFMLKLYPTYVRPLLEYNTVV